ncbi:MAG: hypothetical protein ACAH83_08315 [Alphaproteobacteria bacterium]
MGFHRCEYLTREEGEQLKLRNIDVIYSSGDVTLCFSSGRSWQMPDMARLYIELGWVPPKEFVDDVMNSVLTDGARRQTRGLPAAPQAIGYLNPKDHPLPRPFAISEELPAGFLEKMEEHMKAAADMGHRIQTNGPQTGRAQTKGFRP